MSLCVSLGHVFKKSWIIATQRLFRPRKTRFARSKIQCGIQKSCRYYLQSIPKSGRFACKVAIWSKCIQPYRNTYVFTLHIVQVPKYKSVIFQIQNVVVYSENDVACRIFRECILRILLTYIFHYIPTNIWVLEDLNVSMKMGREIPICQNEMDTFA